MQSTSSMRIICIPDFPPNIQPTKTLLCKHSPSPPNCFNGLPLDISMSVPDRAVKCALLHGKQAFLLPTKCGGLDSFSGCASWFLPTTNLEPYVPHPLQGTELIPRQITVPVGQEQGKLIHQFCLLKVTLHLNFQMLARSPTKLILITDQPKDSREPSERLEKKGPWGYPLCCAEPLSSLIGQIASTRCVALM